MRDILITLMVFGTLPFILRKPYFGILVWSWLSYMNPHKLAFGFAFSMPFAQIVVIVLFASMLFSKENKRIPLNNITIIWLIFILWMGITTIYAYHPDDALEQFIKVIKIQLVTFLTLMLIANIDQLRKLIWVIVFSIGFFSVKGGVYTILTGGSGRVWGPPGGFIEENNALAVAVLMVIPLMVYLYRVNQKFWIKNSLLVAITLSSLTVLGSQSRGALISIVVVGLFFWLKSRVKIQTGVLLVIFTVFFVSFMPESWHDRMQTIENYEQDTSAMSRINSWQYSINAANDNFLGLGFESWSRETFYIYAPDPTDVHSAHSIYLGVAADHGWVGLFMFGLIFFMAWKKLKKIIKETSDNKELLEYNILAKMLQVGLIAYLAGGAFLSLSYFDLPWHFISFVVLLNQFLMQKDDAEENEEITSLKKRTSEYTTVKKYVA